MTNATTKNDAFRAMEREIKSAQKLAADLESRARVYAMRRSIVTRRIKMTKVGEV